MSGFSNPIIGGGGSLVYPSIHSPNYRPGGPGWSINKDGTAEFSGLTLDTALELYYFPSGGAGNLVYSNSSAGGTDRYGNLYLAGSVAYFKFPTGSFGAMQSTEGGFAWYFAASEAGPWTGIYSAVNSLLGALIQPIFALSGSFAVTAGFAGQVEHIWLAPSGDTSGAKDADAINTVFATGRQCVVHLLPGNFWINTPILITNSFQGLQGSGQPFVSTIIATFAGFTNQMVLVSGAAAPLNQVTIRDLALKPNSNTAHGIVFRSNNGLVENVIVQSQAGSPWTGDAFHLALDALPVTSVFDVTMINCYAQLGKAGSSGANGFLVDANFNSCELYACRAQGGTAAATSGGAWGFQVFGGNIKLFACHAFEWFSGGMVISGNSCQVIGGEYETNGGGGGFGLGLRLSGPHNRIIGASFYANNSVDIQELAGADFTRAIGNDLQSGTGVAIVGTHSVFRDNAGYNPVGHLAAPTYTSASAATNTFGVPVRVFVTGSTAVAINGTATGLASGSFELQPGETITPTGAGGSWQWFGT